MKPEISTPSTWLAVLSMGFLVAQRLLSRRTPAATELEKPQEPARDLGTRAALDQSAAGLDGRLAGAKPQLVSLQGGLAVPRRAIDSADDALDRWGRAPATLGELSNEPRLDAKSDAAPDWEDEAAS